MQYFWGSLKMSEFYSGTEVCILSRSRRDGVNTAGILLQCGIREPLKNESHTEDFVLLTMNRQISGSMDRVLESTVLDRWMDADVVLGVNDISVLPGKLYFA